MAFAQANAVQPCTFMHFRIGSKLVALDLRLARLKTRLAWANLVVASATSSILSASVINQRLNWSFSLGPSRFFGANYVSISGEQERISGRSKGEVAFNFHGMFQAT